MMMTVLFAEVPARATASSASQLAAFHRNVPLCCSPHPWLMLGMLLLMYPLSEWPVGSALMSGSGCPLLQWPIGSTSVSGSGCPLSVWLVGLLQ